jgi:hypothetical protein
MAYTAPIVPGLRGQLSSEVIRDQFALISSEFGRMPDTLGSGEKGFTGGQWDSPTLNTPTIVGGTIGSTAHAAVAVTGYHIYNKTDSYDSGLTSGLVGYVRDLTGKLKLYDGGTVKSFWDDSHNFVMGSGSSELATTAAGGFFYLSTVNGLATGAPTAYTGAAPMVFDRLNNKIGIYDSGAWIWTAALS